MTTVEKVALGVSIAGALGVGAVLQAWATHLLQRREKKINIADKSVQIADALMSLTSKMEAELTRAREALAKAQQESEALREELNRTAATRSADDARELERKQKRQAEHLASATSAIDTVANIAAFTRDPERYLLRAAVNRLGRWRDQRRQRAAGR